MYGRIETAFIGKIVREPEFKRVKGGELPLLALSLAVGDGDDTQWVKVSAFKELAEQLAPRLKKGDSVYVEGTLKLERWERDGQPQSGLGVAAWKVEKSGACAIGRNRERRRAGDFAVNDGGQAPLSHGYEFDDALPM
jgi:single-strand DNA-binding protein